MSIYQILSSKPHNSHYLNRYIKFINSCNGSGKIKHHICPKAKDMFPEYKDLKGHSWNLALLTERQHFIAHWMLWKIYRNRPMTGAFNLMNNFLEYTMPSRVYESLRLDVSKPRGPISQETKDKIKATILALEYRHSEERKTKISLAGKGNQHNIGRKAQEETKAKMRKSPKLRPKVLCPHCNKFGNISNMKRYHFENCKLNPSSTIVDKHYVKPYGKQKKITCPHCSKVGGTSAMIRYHFENCKFQ